MTTAEQDLEERLTCLEEAEAQNKKLHHLVGYLQGTVEQLVIRINTLEADARRLRK